MDRSPSPTDPDNDDDDGIDNLDVWQSVMVALLHLVIHDDETPREDRAEAASLYKWVCAHATEFSDRPEAITAFPRLARLLLRGHELDDRVAASLPRTERRAFVEEVREVVHTALGLD